jgi:hypothetical protein
MSLFYRLFIASFILSFACLSGASSQPFSEFKHPLAPGQRSATSLVALNGLNKNQVKVSIVYSIDSIAVANAFNLRNRDPKKYFETSATLGNVVSGKVAAQVILPHKDNPANSRGKVYSAGTKLFYAWTRTNTPAGASEELTVNSPIKSFVMPRTLTIAYMGDSYASGEGAPDGFQTRNSEAVWRLNELCHRSEKSGGMLAIRRIINLNKELEIDYVNTTCSGATLLDFFIKDQDKSDVGLGNFRKNKIQLEQVEDWLRSNGYDGIDILLSDGGGNDVGFGPIASEGLSAFFSDISNNTIMKNDIERQLNLLTETYSAYMDKLNSTIEVGRIVWFNYPNPTKDKNGVLCTPDATRYGFCWGPLEMQISNSDWNYIANDVFVKLNEQVENAANTHGWDFVDISARSNRNGLCNCDDRYFNTFGNSQDNQGDEFGTLHPTPKGFKEIYEIPLYNQILKSINKFHENYIIDAKKRLIEAAKKKAKAEIAWKAKIARITRMVEDNKRIIKINPKIIK